MYFLIFDSSYDYWMEFVAVVVSVLFSVPSEYSDKMTIVITGGYIAGPSGARRSVAEKFVNETGRF